MYNLLNKRVVVKHGNKQPAYDGLGGTIIRVDQYKNGYACSVILDGYNWSVLFDEYELELPNDPLPLPG